MMDGNKDEAYRCIDIAIQSFSEGKLARAEKFLLKAEKLFPTERAKEILTKIKSATSSNNYDGKTQYEEEKVNSDEGRRRKNSGSRNEPEYTKEQLESVKKVKKCKDFYEILNVTKEASESEIKKAYKKLALQLHPDKNKAPGSVEAFKAVGNAAAILTDAEKRKAYDLYGINDPNKSPFSSSSGMRNPNFGNEYAYARGFQADVSADDLFNMFFGGGFPQQHTFMRQQRRRQQRDERENAANSSTMINLLPILLLIGLSMMSSLFISEPVYSLTPSNKYSVKRETVTLKIPYYVRENFFSEYQGSVLRLEESVEEDFLNHLKHSCSRERNYKESMLAKARTFGDRELFRKAQNINMPSCENLQKYLHI